MFQREWEWGKEGTLDYQYNIKGPDEVKFIKKNTNFILENLLSVEIKQSNSGSYMLLFIKVSSSHSNCLDKLASSTLEDLC